MATIKTTLTLHDGMTSKLRTINVALDGVISAIKGVERAAQGTTRAVDRFRHGFGKGLGVVIAQNRQLSNQITSIRTAIDANTAAQGRFNNKLKESHSHANKLWQLLRRGTTAYFGVQGAGGIIQTADNMTMANSRIGLMSDVASGKTTTQEVSNKIYAAALRSRGGYLDMMDSVSKLSLQTGDLFGSSDEVIAFMENFNKMAVVSGANAQQTSAALLQLTQAMASGELRGDELRSVRENMPVIMQAIAKEMGTTADKVVELGYDGKISSEILKNAMFNSIEEIEKKFNTIPYTWGQVWQTIKTYTLKATTPILKAISAITSNKRFIAFANGVGNVISVVSGLIMHAFNALKPVLAWIYDTIAAIYNFFKNNWSLIAPIVVGVAAAFVALKAPLIAVAIWTTICTAATKAWTAVQAVFNAVMYANPVTWIILAIIALIAVIYLVCAAMRKWTDSSVSATGVIAGAFMWLLALLYNVFYVPLVNMFIGIWNVCLGVAQWCVQAWNWAANNMGAIFENIGIWWENLWIDAQIGFNNFISTVLSKLASLAQKIAPLAELMDIDLSGITGAANEYSVKNANLKASKRQYREITSFNPNIDWGIKDYKEFASLGDAYNKGYDWGSNLANEVSDAFSVDSLIKKYGSGLGAGDGGMNDIGKALSGGLGSNPALDKIAANTGDIANNTSDMADASDEELSFMKDMAEREAINRYTLTDMKLNMTNNNNISKDVDADSLLERIAKQIYDAVISGANGAHV